MSPSQKDCVSKTKVFWVNLMISVERVKFYSSGESLFESKSNPVLCSFFYSLSDFLCSSMYKSSPVPFFFLSFFLIFCLCFSLSFSLSLSLFLFHIFCVVRCKKKKAILLFVLSFFTSFFPSFSLFFFLFHIFCVIRCTKSNSVLCTLFLSFLLSFFPSLFLINRDIKLDKQKSTPSLKEGKQNPGDFMWGVSSVDEEYLHFSPS